MSRDPGLVGRDDMAAGPRVKGAKTPNLVPPERCEFHGFALFEIAFGLRYRSIGGLCCCDALFSFCSPLARLPS
jgi:hypothetical protein